MKKATKILIILLINILILAAFFIMIEGFFYLKEFPLNKKHFRIEDVEYKFRISGQQYKKPPILIYGCSFAYGARLNETEHLGYILSEQTKRPVYNFGIEARGLQHALFIMKNQKKIEPSPEYIIYVYIDDQIRRLYQTCMNIDPYYLLEYEQKDGKFVQKQDKLAPLRNTLLYKNIYSKFIYPQINQEKRFKLLKKYLEEMKNEISQKYPPAPKFVFLIYLKSNKPNYPKNLEFTDDMINEIKQMGIDVIDLSVIFGKKLYEQDMLIKRHPSAKAWQIITPEIIKMEKM